MQLSVILTYSMVQSPSWEVNWFAASQEIPRISRNPKVHYCTHKRSPTVSILGQPNPVHTLTSHLLEIRPNIIHPSTPRSPQWSLSLRFPHQDPIHPPLLTRTCHMPSPSHSSRFTINMFHIVFMVLWGWHDSVKTRRSVWVCEIIVHLLVIVQINKRCTLHVLKYVWNLFTMTNL